MREERLSLVVRRLESPSREPSSQLLKFSFSMTSSPLVMPRYGRITVGREITVCIEGGRQNLQRCRAGSFARKDGPHGHQWRQCKWMRIYWLQLSIYPLRLSIYCLKLSIYQLKLSIDFWNYQLIELQRLSRCDRVLLMEGGRIVVSGTHSELLTLSDQYSTYCHDASQRCKGYTIDYRIHLSNSHNDILFSRYPRGRFSGCWSIEGGRETSTRSSRLPHGSRVWPSWWDQSHCGHGKGERFHWFGPEKANKDKKYGSFQVELVGLDKGEAAKGKLVADEEDFGSASVAFDVYM